MPFVIVYQSLEGSSETDHPTDRQLRGLYLRSYNVEAFDGRGTCDWTDDLRAALLFPSTAAAMQTWNTQSTKRPLRPDGRPNKPLTAFTVAICEV